MYSAPSKNRKSFIERYAVKSVAHELLIWYFFWGLYSLWAGYSPSYPNSNHSEPFFPFVVLVFMLAFFFIFGDRHELKILINNSILSLLLIPGFLVLNIYRALTDQFPASWTNAGFFLSQYTFFFIQCGYLVLAILHMRYTARRWKTADVAFKKRLYLSIIWAVVFTLFLFALVMLFVFAGKINI
ncbi:hypothetical protein JW824_14535 [bacterium]|nr:hypothetical protein [bacterium]